MPKKDLSGPRRYKVETLGPKVTINYLNWYVFFPYLQDVVNSSTGVYAG